MQMMKNQTAILAFTVVIISGALLCIQDDVRPALSASVFSFTDETSYAEGVSSSTPAVTPSTEKFILPILVYHIVRPSYPSDSVAVQKLALTPETFDAEMNYLGSAGYHVVPMNAVEDFVKSGTPLPTHPIVITFDDGWGDQYQYAFPILQKYHYTATFFVFTNPIGTKGFMTWDNLREMLAAGQSIGSHSRSHPYLTRISDPTALHNELWGSKETLEKKLGISIHDFAYPFGKYNESIAAAVAEAGYVSARGDRYYNGELSEGRLYELDGMNAPTTLELFTRKFPPFR